MSEPTPPPAPGLCDKPVPGTELQIGYYSYTTPAMLLDDVVECVTTGVFDTIAKYQAASRERDAGQMIGLFSPIGVEFIHAVQRLAYLSLKRNYPGLTPEDVAQLIDLSNMGPIQLAIFRMNRLEVRPTEAAPAPTPAAAPEVPRQVTVLPGAEAAAG